MEKDINEICCPICKKQNCFDLRNVGFVNCEWILKGRMNLNKDSKLYCEGKTYDGKLYTFKETNYQKAFEQLHILAKHIKDQKFQNNSELSVESSVRDSEVIDPA